MSEFRRRWQGGGRHLFQVRTGVGLGCQLEELLLVQLVDLRQLLLLLQDDVFKGLDLAKREKEVRRGVRLEVERWGG